MIHALSWYYCKLLYLLSLTVANPLCCSHVSICSWKWLCSNFTITLTVFCVVTLTCAVDTICIFCLIFNIQMFDFIIMWDQSEMSILLLLCIVTDTLEYFVLLIVAPSRPLWNAGIMCSYPLSVTFCHINKYNYIASFWHNHTFQNV